MAFVGDNQIKRMDRDVQPVCLLFQIRVDGGLRKTTFRTEQVSGHALNGRYVNESVAGLGIREIFVGQHLRIKRLIIAKILFLEPLAVYFVFLGELVAVWVAKALNSRTA